MFCISLLSLSPQILYRVNLITLSVPGLRYPEYDVLLSQNRYNMKNGHIMTGRADRTDGRTITQNDTEQTNTTKQAQTHSKHKTTQTRRSQAAQYIAQQRNVGTSTEDDRSQQNVQARTQQNETQQLCTPCSIKRLHSACVAHLPS